MYLQADQLPSETVLHDFDICIVGAGAAGIAMAKRLIGSSKKVLLLSSGSPSDKGRPEEKRQAMYKGTVGSFLKKVDPVFLDRSRLHMYGGTTNHFGFWSRPLDEIDFCSRPGYRTASWPFGLTELAPYYQDAHHFGQFGPFNYDDKTFWEEVLYARCFPSEPGDALGGAIIRAQYAEDLHDFQIQFGEELRQAQNVSVLFNATLQRIETTDNQKYITGLNCATIHQGKHAQHFRVQAASYVLAMGGIENVRLLKLAGDLGDNAAHHLGRGFMVHPLVEKAAKVRFAQPVSTEIRSFFRDQQIRLQPPNSEGGEYTHITVPLVNPELIFDYCIFNTWGILVPTAEVLKKENIGNFRLILRFLSSTEAIVNINWEQIPNEDSRITLNPNVVDPVFGQSVSHLEWQLLEEDKRTMVRALELCEAYLRKHGAVDFHYLTDVSGDATHWTFPPDEGALATGDHHMGALRMSVNPEDGIVNADSRFHTIDNLYAAGCAVFPTGGFANPTLTIVALALRLADHLGSR